MALYNDVGIHQKGSISLQDIIEDVKRGPQARRIGCILTFTGVVRGIASNGSEVVKLEYEAYDEAARLKLEEIVRDLKKIQGIVDVRIHHFVGSLSVGEDIVYIVVAAEHREEGFNALREAIERLKSEVPIWKKEHTVSSSYWVGLKGNRL
ncbi:MAG: molybdenum cofactor biosynthesis protein MoaE [Candidatus Nezhaarchaeota archaeon]|nr:molybdenum cofactor biosynthesis protein MoaE [Candidatus Nezhaarchaeota archaeon]